MRYAELAAREALNKGRSTAFVFTAESSVKAEYRRELIRALRLAIAEDQLDLYYQPIVDVTNGRVHSLEALARWRHPELGPVSPATFIPLAESAGLMAPFCMWTLRRACREALSLVDEECLRVAVNVSVTQLLDIGFLSGLYAALDETGFPPTALELEVTESVFAQDLERVRSLLQDIQRLGVAIAIDDFGAGYSSLGYLNKLPVNILKTDGIFMRDFATGGEAIIGATLEMARKLGLETVVEGVETAEMRSQVQAIGGKLLQGYHFARPMPASALKEWRASYRASVAARDLPIVPAIAR
jgi:diguanylate cyclase